MNKKRRRKKKQKLEAFRTCIDRPYVQKELGWGKLYEKDIIVIVEEDKRRQGYLDVELAREKYREPHQLSYLLDIEHVPYRRDRNEAAAMVEHLLTGGGGELSRQRSAAAPAESPLNAPGHWDFFLSHGQAAAGDAVKTLCLLLKDMKQPNGEPYTVWYDNDMMDRSTAAMEEVRATSLSRRNIILHYALAPPTGHPLVVTPAAAGDRA